MRLIDADELKDWSEIVPLTGDGGIDINDFDEKLKSMPTIDAVPVIRCKDCKYYLEDSYGEDEWIMCRRTNLYMYTDEDKYCAWAKRKEE